MSEDLTTNLTTKLDRFGSLDGLHRGFRGTAEQRTAVEGHYGVKISEDASLWRDNDFAPFFSTTDKRILLKVDTSDFKHSSWMMQTMVRNVFTPTLELFETHHCEWFSSPFGTKSEVKALAREWPCGILYREHGYVDRRTRIIRASEFDKDGREIDVSESPHASGGPSGSWQQFMLVTITDSSETHCSAHVRWWNHPKGSFAPTLRKLAAHS